jgi:hypothetical protein
VEILEDTILGTAPLYYCVRWAWDDGFKMCESTSYIITRVDATSFKSLFLIISIFGCRRILKVGPPTNLEVNILMMSG